MPPIVINKSHGEFCLSHQAFLRLRELGQQDALQETDPALYWPLSAPPQDPDFNQCGRLIPRDDLKLVQVVTELGGKANGYCAELKVVDVPTDVRWEIEKTRGVEHVSERHRTWG